VGNKTGDKQDRRLRGPAAFLADGDSLTAWRADRGAGRRNTESVAVAQFESPVTLPAGTKLKVALLLDHGGDGSGYRNTQIGRFRVALTQAAEPKVNRTAYAAILAMQTPAEKRTAQQQQSIFDAWRLTVPALKAFNDQIEKQWAAHPEAQTTVLHLSERRGMDVRQTKLLDRGVWNQGKDVVKPLVLGALHVPEGGAPADRLAFARWLVDKRSPLAARVAVNRLWQAVFGIGLVETAEDFGTRAPEPSHPELLDSVGRGLHGARLEPEASAARLADFGGLFADFADDACAVGARSEEPAAGDRFTIPCRGGGYPGRGASGFGIAV